MIKIKSYETVIVVNQYILGILFNGDEIGKIEKIENFLNLIKVILL